MFSQTLVQGLNSMPDRPWREKRGGKGITVAWLAEQLQPYGIRPGPMRVGQAQARGYWEEDFQEAFQRYMSRSDMDALKASLQAHQRVEDGRQKAEDGANQKSEVRDQRSEAQDAEGGGEEKSDSPSPDSGATKDGGQKQSEDGGPKTEDSDHGKDEPGEAQGGEAAAA